MVSCRKGSSACTDEMPIGLGVIATPRLHQEPSGSDSVGAANQQPQLFKYTLRRIKNDSCGGLASEQDCSHRD